MKKLFVGLLSIGLLNSGYAQCPQASFTSTAPACQNDALDFTNTSVGATGGGSWSYFWDFDYPNGNSTSPSGTSTAENPTGFDYSPGGNGTYTVAFTITDGTCTSTVLQDVYIRRADANFISSTNSACVNEQVTYYNDGIGASSPNATVVHSWSFGVDATPSTSSLAVPPSVTYSSPGAKTVTHLVDVQFLSCGSNRQDAVTQTVIINESPVVSFTSTAPVCAGSNVDFTYSGTTSTVDQYSWDFGNNSTPSLSTASNPNSISYNSGGVKSVSLNVINEFGCVANAAQNITINSLPVIDAGADTTICANTSVQIGAATIAGTNYQWFPTNSVVISDPATSNPTVSPIANATQLFLTGTDANGCINTDTVMVIMLDPLVADAGVDVEICRYDSIQIGAGIIEGQLYTWSPTDGLLGMNSSNAMVSPDSSITYMLSVTDLYGCATEVDYVSIIVNQLPIANAGIDDSITSNSSTQLVATGGVQYSWMPEDGLSNAGINDPIASPDSSTVYVVTVIDIYGCIQTDTMSVTVIAPSFWLPNAFSPDGDMINDVFYVRGEGVTGFEFSIFDQWGHVIFISNDMSIGWNGSYPTGEQLPKGAYVYHVSGTLTDGTLVNDNGLVNLIR